MPGPMSGVRVLDLSQVVSGPMASMVLADQGADVVKVEPVGGIDSMRMAGQQPSAAAAAGGGLGALYAMVNRGKRVITLDLKSPRGVALFLRLARWADVVVQNFRPGAADRMGVGYEACKAVNPGVIYVSVSGFGEAGPLAQRPIYDPVIQGVAGVAAAEQTEGTPRLAQFLICDKTTALTVAQAITAALFSRKSGQGGQHVRVSMLDATLQFNWPDVFYNHAYTESPAPKMPAMANFYRLWACRDGLITMITVQDKEFAGWCRAMGRMEWLKDPRYSSLAARIPNLPGLFQRMAEDMAPHTRDELLSRLGGNGVPCGPVLSLDEVVDHEQVRPSLALYPTPAGPVRQPRPAARFAGAAPPAPHAAPAVGQHSAEVLRGVLGVGDAEVAALLRDGVIAGPTPAPKL